MSSSEGIRLLSYSEIARAMTCQAQWDFSYGGHLAGDALKPKRLAPILSEGRAWGAGVAAYHSGDSEGAGKRAREAIEASLEADADEQREHGVHDQGAHEDLHVHLMKLFLHYVWEADDFDLRQDGIEREINVALPSRSGNRKSNRYHFQCFVDGVREIFGQPWLVEFKLRTSLTSVEQIQLMRQIRWYAWAWWQESGIKPAGVEVHERLNQEPKPVRILQSGKPSHAKDQLCTADAYLDACAEHDVEVNEDTAAALKARKWQQVVPIIFRDGELEEAGRELVSAAKLIRDLDSGELWPVRNAKPQNCRGCSFKDICPAPDSMLVDQLYERRPAKRNRPKEQQT